ncbi:MAG: DIP1984 family protein [Thermomicrobia bacterium]|nr:DIP1984 family protein [Thermomicrobia bacterium]
MKLSEALILRADIQKRVEQLRARLQASVMVQEGEQPPENPQALFAELDALLLQLGTLIAQINRTNLHAQLASGQTVTDALARRDTLALRISVLRSAADTAATPVARYGRAEIRRLPAIDIAALRQQIDTLARDLRELDTAIQATNWTTDLME